jgi:hypothetical protein
VTEPTQSMNKNRAEMSSRKIENFGFLMAKCNGIHSVSFHIFLCDKTESTTILLELDIQCREYIKLHHISIIKA